MKKIMDKSFWIILVISLITLTALTVGVVLMTKESQEEFYSAGYIIDTTTAKGDKYYFDDNTKYKENVFNEYVFKNKDNKEINTPKENFIHYSDKSLSFMKNGVLLDLDNFDEKLVPYYNITDKSIIKYNNGSYNIETADKTLVFNNFIGKINDNKYIIVGNEVHVKLAGSEETATGNYFELIFVEDGIVKIINEENSYQTMTDGTIISVGDNIKINLGDKSVTYGDEVKLSLDEMTINGNENIDIKPATGKVDKEDDKNGNTNEGTTTDEPQGNGNETADDTTGENGDGNKVKSVLKKEIAIDLIDAKVNPNTISAEFQVIDTGNYINGDLILTLQNITKDEPNRIKEIVVNAGEKQVVNFSKLIPNCNYLMTITAKNDISETQYFQKVFKTESINDVTVKLEMANTDSLEYLVEFNNETVKSIELMLTDDNKKQVGNIKTAINGIENNNYNVSFDGLKNNKKYNLKMKSITYTNGGSSNNIDETNEYIRSDMTLKQKPGNVTISTVIDEENQRVILKSSNQEDIDRSITKYTYKIYKNPSGNDEAEKGKPIYSFYKMREQLETKMVKGDDESEHEIIVGTKEIINSEIKSILEKYDEDPKTEDEYAFSLVIEYYDNYKKNEIETPISDNFYIPASKPFQISFIPDSEKGVSYDEINGVIEIKDTECRIPNEDRECKNEKNNFTVKYGAVNDIFNEKLNIYPKFEEKELGSNILNSEKIHLSGLSGNTYYLFEVYADEYKNGDKIAESYIGSFMVKTTPTESLKMQNWSQNDYNYDIPISVSTKITSAVAGSDTIDKLDSITYYLYKGDKTTNEIEEITEEPLASYTLTGNDIIKNEIFNITSKDFGIENLEGLKELTGSDGKLEPQYTIVADNARDANNKFEIINNKFLFTTPPLLILESQVNDIDIDVLEITNEQAEAYGKEKNPNINEKDIVIGYKVTAKIGIDNIKNINVEYYPKKINFYVYDNNRLIESKSIDIIKDVGDYTTYFYLKNGTDNNIRDEDLRRGNQYTFAFDMSIDIDNKGTESIIFPSKKIKSDKKIAKKQEPTINMYIDNSDSSSITYKYNIKDYDNAFYKDEEDNKKYIYYTIGENEEEYKSEMLENNTFTISNLTNASIYSIKYLRATDKISTPSKVRINNYYFDGSYNASDSGLSYKLEYGGFNNILKIIPSDNEILNRVTAYFVTLKADGEEPYTKLISQKEFKEKKYIEVDYSDIANFKNKEISVYLEAFYDTGYIGFSQPSRLGDYFQNMGLADSTQSPHLGYLFQETSINISGNYIYLRDNPGNKGKYSKPLTPIPTGILGYEATINDTEFKINNVTSIMNITDKKFEHYGTISNSNSAVKLTLTANGVEAKDGTTGQTFTINPKVLDVISIEPQDSNSFMFKSIIPKVSSTEKPTINGATINVNLSIDPTTLSTDFKGNFYIDIYKKSTCDSEETECTIENILVKTIKTDYDGIQEVTFDGLDPATKYYYKISADMIDSDERQQLYDLNGNGYVEYFPDFETLNKNNIFEKISYSYKSEVDEGIYNKRTLLTTLKLKTTTNFDVKFEIYDIEDTLVYENTIANANLEKSNLYSQDITGNDTVFGDNYYTLKIYAIPTDGKNNKLELYNEKLVYNELQGYKYKKLLDPKITIESEAKINGENNHIITAKIAIEDYDKVIKDGIVKVALYEATAKQDENGEYHCPDEVEECVKTFDLKTQGKLDSFTLTEEDISFEGLKKDTGYIIDVYVETFKNNIGLEEKSQIMHKKQTQYTKSDLGFSLGLVTPTTMSSKQLKIAFVGATAIDQYITGIDYDIGIQGGAPLKSGGIGKTSSNPSADEVINFHIKNDGSYEPYLLVNLDNAFGKINILKITYYYREKGGSIEPLKDNNNSTVFTYSFEYNN